MAYTRVGRIDHFDAGNGGRENQTPNYWPEDVIFLINEEKPKTIVERNIIFKGQEITGLMSGDTTPQDRDRIVLVKCPPYLRSMQEIF